MRNKLSALIFTCIISFSIPTFAQEPIEVYCPKNETPQIVIEKKGTVEAEPDTAEFSVNIWIERVKADDAVEEVKKRVDKITSVLAEENIQQKNIKTTVYQVNPLYDGKSLFSRVQKPTSYTVTQNLRVTINDLLKVGKILGKISGLDSVNIQNINFTSSKMTELQREALSAAATEARKSAESAVTAAGGKLGRILKIEENSFTPPVYQRHEMKMMAMDSMATQESDLAVSGGTIKVETTCRVTYEIL